MKTAFNNMTSHAFSIASVTRTLIIIFIVALMMRADDDIIVERIP